MHEDRHISRQVFLKQTSDVLILPGTILSLPYNYFAGFLVDGAGAILSSLIYTAYYPCLFPRSSALVFFWGGGGSGLKYNVESLSASAGFVSISYTANTIHSTLSVYHYMEGPYGFGIYTA